MCAYTQSVVRGLCARRVVTGSVCVCVHAECGEGDCVHAECAGVCVCVYMQRVVRGTVCTQSGEGECVCVFTQCGEVECVCLHRVW